MAREGVSLPCGIVIASEESTVSGGDRLGELLSCH
jgi:hypothetical protein